MNYEIAFCVEHNDVFIISEKRFEMGEEVTRGKAVHESNRIERVDDAQ